LQLYRDLAVMGPQHVNPLWLRNSNPAALMMLGAIQHKLQGVNLTVSSGESAALDGLLHCCNSLQTEASSAMVLLGCESIWLELQRYFEKRGMLAPSVAESVPFGRDSKGAILGECAAALVLEPPAEAEARGAPILAEVLAVVSRAGESERALRCAIDRALAEAGARPESIRFIVAAANGYPQQDALEARVLSSVFQGTTPLITSVKGSIGECLSAAGLASILVALQAGQEGVLPPLRGLEQQTPELRLPVVKRQPAEVGPGLALVTVIGHLGGAAVTLLRV
jgi:3-oxoacyl-(acyl-carrier-protein) synthase